MKAAALTRYIHSQGFAALILAVALPGVLGAYLFGEFTPITGDKGFVIPSANEWILQPWADLVAALVANAAIVAMAGLTDKFFNVLRSNSALPLTIFAVLQLATPGLSVQFYTGTALALTAAGCLMILFSCYHSPTLTRRVFLIFLILSAACATQYCYALYIPVFLLGCAQMRIFNARTVVAALLGLITPWWIMGACGMLNPGNIRVPNLVSIFSVINRQMAVHLLVTIGLTSALLIGCFILNVMKTIAYNARARAYSGAFATLSLVTLAGMLIDYNNLISYIPLLNYCAAYEVAGYFSSHRGERTGVAVACIVLLYIILYICQIQL